MKNKIKVIVLVVFLISLLIYASYVHRNEPDWMNVQKVKIVD